MTTTAFSPWRGELGSSCAADVFRYLLGCFRLRGGRVFDGIRWIYKVVREIAEATGYCERQVRRALVRLVQEGWIIREQKEKHGIKPGDGGFRRRFWYAPGPHCPVPLRGRTGVLVKAAPMSASSMSPTSTPDRTTPSKGDSPAKPKPENGTRRYVSPQERDAAQKESLELQRQALEVCAAAKGEGGIPALEAALKAVEPRLRALTVNRLNAVQDITPREAARLDQLVASWV